MLPYEISTLSCSSIHSISLFSTLQEHEGNWQSILTSCSQSSFGLDIHENDKTAVVRVRKCTACGGFEDFRSCGHVTKNWLAHPFRKHVHLSFLARYRLVRIGLIESTPWNLYDTSRLLLRRLESAPFGCHLPTCMRMPVR